MLQPVVLPTQKILNQRLYPCLPLCKAIRCRKFFQFSINPVEFRDLCNAWYATELFTAPGSFYPLPLRHLQRLFLHVPSSLRLSLPAVFCPADDTAPDCP